MRNKYLLLLLAAGAFLSLTGCEKEPNTMKGDPQEVRFSVVTANPETKTVYTGEGTVDPDNDDYLIWERIDWVKGDKILIWSDYAVEHHGNQDHFATYAVDTPTRDDFNDEPYPNRSWSLVKDEADLGLIYNDEYKDKKYQFWSIYPASAATNSPAGGTGDSANEVKFDISDSQGDTENTGTAPNVVFKPNMDRAVMLAAVKDADYNSDIEFKFYPAFTAFEFTLSTQDGEALNLTKVVLSSEESPLAGTVTAAVESDTRTNGSVGNLVGGSTYVVSATKNEITYDLSSGIPENGELTFTVFALPQDVKGLKLKFYDGETLIATGRLAYNGEDITFGACLKHCIRGVKIPTGWSFSYLTFDLKVLDWEGVDITGDSSDFPQASQFAVTGEGVKNGYTDLHLGLQPGGSEQKDPYRQQWYFIDGQTVSVFFKVMLPQDGKWELEVVGGTEENPVEADAALFTFTNAYDEDDTKPLEGNIGHNGETAVKINITYNGPEGEAHSFFFHTYAYDTAGNKYNIDSETQIYDRGRGYHTFFVNNSVYNNN